MIKEIIIAIYGTSVKSRVCMFQTKMEGVTERHLPMTDDSSFGPASERC